MLSQLKMWQYRRHTRKKQRVSLDSGHLWQCDISSNRVECWRLHQDWSKGSKAAPNELPVSLDAHRVSLLDQGAADLIRSYHCFSKGCISFGFCDGAMLDLLWSDQRICRRALVTDFLTGRPVVVAKWNPWSCRSSRDHLGAVIIGDQAAIWSSLINDCHSWLKVSSHTEYNLLKPLLAPKKVRPMSHNFNLIFDESQWFRVIFDIDTKG